MTSESTGRRNVAEFVDDLVNLSKASSEHHVVLTQFCQHV
jgi:hypothetical protein